MLDKCRELEEQIKAKGYKNVKVWFAYNWFGYEMTLAIQSTDFENGNKFIQVNPPETLDAVLKQAQDIVDNMKVLDKVAIAKQKLLALSYKAQEIAEEVGFSVSVQIDTFGK